MRYSARCTTISWIPSEAISGYTRMPFDLGITHYDAPPPDVIDDLETVVGPDGARFGNRLSAWIEVEDDRIVGHGQDGRGTVSNSAVRLGGMRVLVEAVEFPVLRSEPEVTDEYVRFTQTAGGRPGLPAPRRVAQAPYLKIEGPTVWTTLELTLHRDGASEARLAGGSSFPRHWLYDSSGALVGKSAVIDFKAWYSTSSEATSPWGSSDSAVPVAEAESQLERRLSTLIMRHGHRPPKPHRASVGTTVLRQGATGTDLVLLLDGVLGIEVDGEVVAEVGPGSVLGERSALESGARTATARALTSCHYVTVPHEWLDDDDLAELAHGHHREDERSSGS